MLVYSAVVPHSPLLLPTIGKEHQTKSQKTLDAIKTIAEDLYLSRSDTLIIVSSHETQHDTAFSINLTDEYRTDFSEFGDLSTSTSFAPDKGLIAAIRRAGRDTDMPITLDSVSKLNFGSGVPLELLASKHQNLNIIPISYSGLSAKEHLSFGALLKDVISHTNKRVAVIASGDLSHCHISDAPGGFHKDAKAFDDEIVRAVTEQSKSALINLDDAVRSNAKACVYEQLLILFGILDKQQLRPEILSYEAPFGVGYLVAQFHI
jgi:MEMO1 family protein